MEFPNQTTILYVTVCVRDRRPLLAAAEIHALLLSAWQRADRWLVGRYVVMPDHVHFFCAPGTFPTTPIKRWMEFWRSDVSRRWPRPEEKPIWQKDFFDRRLRHGESYTAKGLYISENPVRANLVARAEDWPFGGALHPLAWHDPSPA